MCFAHVNNNIAQKKTAEFIRWKSTELAEKSSDKSFVHSLGKNIEAKLKASQHNRPAFAPALTVEAFENDHWYKLKAAEKSRVHFFPLNTHSHTTSHTPLHTTPLILLHTSRLAHTKSNVIQMYRKRLCTRNCTGRSG